MLASERRLTSKIQLGIFDGNILCQKCDNFLNRRYDEPAFEFIKNFEYLPGELDEARSHFEKPNVNGDMLCGFILSVLWRCSVSKRFETSNVSLGQFENPAREVLWEIRSLSRLPAYRVLCQRYLPRPGVEKMYSLPMPASCDFGHHKWNAYLFMLAGFRFMVILDPQPFPVEFDRYFLNGNKTLRGSLIDFPTTYEALQAQTIVALHRKN